MAFKIILACLVAATVVLSEPEKPSDKPGLKLLRVIPSKGDKEMEPIWSTFDCTNRMYGYYADLENDCKYFHICHKMYRRDRSYFMIQSTFKCPSGTTFNQAEVSCDYNAFVGPCEDSDYNSNKIFTTPAPFYPKTTMFPLKRRSSLRKKKPILDE